MRLAGLLIAISLPLAAVAESSAEATTAMFVSASRNYENGHYERAARMLEQVIADAPNCARCAHLLGKSYGHMAEQASWTEAISLAKKTRLALEQAVELAPDDPDALRDLIRYYRAAPGFLGGSKEKARQLEQRLQRTGAKRTG